MIVGDDILGVPFIKISFCSKRTVNLQSKYGRTVPTDLCVFDIFDCRGDSQCFRRKLAACQVVVRHL